MGDRKLLVDECAAFCPHALIKRGEDSGVLNGEIEYNIRDDLHEVRTRYLIAKGTYIWKRLRLEKGDTHFGGTRWYIRCPRCQSRRTTLYLPYGDFDFACRACLCLGYQSQLLQTAERAELALRNLAERYPVPRPKGRWWKTYFRDLYDRAVAEQRIWERLRIDPLEASARLGLLKDLVAHPLVKEKSL